MVTQAIPPLPIHKLDVEIYNRMVASGALEDEPVELLEGWLVDVMSPQSPGHATIIERLTRAFARSQARLRIQLPLEVPPDSEPEPDLALIADPSSPAYHPRTALLVVEVSVSTHAIDRGVKAHLYAKASVPTYWLIDVPGKTVEVRSDPDSDSYRRCDTYPAGTQVPSPAPGVDDLDVNALLQDVGG